MSAADLVIALGGRWDKSRGYGFVCCPSHIDKTPSLKIKDGPDGDVILHCFAGCAWRDIKDDLRNRGLLPPLNGERGRAPIPSQIQNGGTNFSPARSCDTDTIETRNIELAQQIWHSALPAPGTPVETYLCGRGITISIPPSIRYAPNLRHTPS